MTGLADPRARPRWAPLPDDPPALKQWLAGQDAAEHPATAVPDDWPREES